MIGIRSLLNFWEGSFLYRFCDLYEKTEAPQILPYLGRLVDENTE